MGILDNYFPMGLGTAHLPIKNAKDKDGIVKSSELILYALEAGINYIDTSYPYANGGAHAALKLAFAQTNKPYGVTVKVIHQSDKTADEAIRRVESQLTAMGIDRATFFVCWCIQNYKQFTEIMTKGGVYDGAIKLKQQGIIDYICGSLHTSPEDSIKIIQSGVFEAVTISFNLANAVQTIPVLDEAIKCNIDVAVMNPLGGGGIPRNPHFFSFAQSQNESTVMAALRFANVHPAVKVVLCGSGSRAEFIENQTAFTEPSAESDADRVVRVLKRVKDIKGFCVNCHYCDVCPADIPVSKIMNTRNRLLFPNITTQNYRRNDSELLQNINLFQGQTYSEDSDDWFPESTDNPCVNCGACEKKCTQNLNIVTCIADIYARASKHGFSAKTHKDRLYEILVNKEYKRVGLYPKDRYADLIINLYNRYFGTPSFEWIAFNSDPNMWGRRDVNVTIYNPKEIPVLKPDIIIVCNYTYDTEIYNDLQHYKTEGIEVIKLHKEKDMPWLF